MLCKPLNRLKTQSLNVDNTLLAQKAYHSNYNVITQNDMMRNSSKALSIVF